MVIDIQIDGMITTAMPLIMGLLIQAETRVSEPTRKSLHQQFSTMAPRVASFWWPLMAFPLNINFCLIDLCFTLFGADPYKKEIKVWDLTRILKGLKNCSMWTFNLLETAAKYSSYHTSLSQKEYGEGHVNNI